jgi:hypothetical protein
MAGNKTRIMYLELKTGYSDNGPARIGRVSFSRTGRTVYYKDKQFLSIGGSGIGANYLNVETNEQYWISGPKRNGSDRHTWGAGPIEIDADVVEEYWRDIRRCQPPKNACIT